MRWLRAKRSVTGSHSTDNDHHYYYHTYYSKVSITYLLCYTGHKYCVIYYVLCCALSLQLCLTLCDPMDHSPPGFCVHGMFQARILEWIAISAFRGYSQPRDETYVSYISCTAGRFFTTESPGKPMLFTMIMKIFHMAFLCRQIRGKLYQGDT